MKADLIIRNLGATKERSNAILLVIQNLRDAWITCEESKTLIILDYCLSQIFFQLLDLILV